MARKKSLVAGGLLVGLFATGLLAQAEASSPDELILAQDRLERRYSPLPPSRKLPVPKPACGTKRISPIVKVYPLRRHTGGDTEMAGHRVSITVEGELTRTLGRVRVRGSVGMGEVKGDLTTFRDTYDRIVFDVATSAPGCEIKSVKFSESDFAYLGPTREFGLISGRSRKDDHKFRMYNARRRGAGPQLIKWARCRADTKGKDAGKIGCDQIQFRPLVIELVPRSGTCSRYQLHLPGRVPHGYYNRGFKDVYPLGRDRGDGEMGRNPVQVHVKTQLLHDSRFIRLYNRVTMVEKGGDKSTFGGSTNEVIFDVERDAPGCTIQSVSGAKVGERKFIRKKHRHDFLGTGRDGLLADAMCRVDTKGKDSGKLGCSKFSYTSQFHNVELVSQTRPKLPIRR